jgi:hypothetical protein
MPAYVDLPPVPAVPHAPRFAMRVVIKLGATAAPEDCSLPLSIIISLGSAHSECEEQENNRMARQDATALSENSVAATCEVVSVFIGGPHDEQLRRDIPVGEHIVEDPAFDAIGFYGLAGIDRGGGVVAQWYRWILNDETNT